MARRDPSYIDVHVGSRIRMRRQLINMSQERLGELLGITFQQVQKYEKGSNRISASRLFYTCKTLGVPIQFFFEGLPGMEPDGSIVAYETPEFASFALSAYWGEDDVWNIGLGYRAANVDQFVIAAAAAVNENLQGEIDGLPDHRTVSGSVSLLHTPSGLNLSLAGGQRQYIASATDNSPYFGYLKIGWQTVLVSAGPTAFYAEYGRFRDFLGSNTSADTVTGIDGGASSLDLNFVCAGANTACLVSDSDATIEGAGVVQHIDGAGAQIYLGARHHQADIGLVDAQGTKVRAAPLSGFDTVIGGLLIEF